MGKFVVLSAAEQVTAHLREELLRGTWSGGMPGGDRLAAELGIGRDTVEAALKRLEAEGLLENQGRRRGRRIVLPEGAIPSNGIRVAVVLFSKDDRSSDYLLKMEYRLKEQGHKVVYAPMSLVDLGMKVARVARMVGQIQADAWVVQGGVREVLEWFAERGMPTMAMFGRRRNVAVAGVGPEKIPAIREATKTLLGLGHQRIVFLSRSINRLPEPAPVMRAFLEELEAHGITPGPYHLPDWEETVAGLDARLKSLFKLTPPTAMIVDEAQFYVAVRHFLGHQRLATPDDVSLVCTDDDLAFAWCMPPVSHIRWDRDVVARRVAQWVSNITQGKKDLRQTMIPAEFVRGGTIGPAKREH